RGEGSEGIDVAGAGDAGEGPGAGPQGGPGGDGPAARDLRQAGRDARPHGRHAAPGRPDAGGGQRLDRRGARQPARGDAGPAGAGGAGEAVSLLGAVRRGAPEEGGEQVKRAGLAVLLAMSGCVGALKSDYPERRFYTLSAARPGSAEYETDFYNAFFAPPASQATEQTQRWLGASGLFSAVVGTGSAVPETHVLEGNLISLHTDGRQSHGEAPLVLQVMLIRVSSD